MVQRNKSQIKKEFEDFAAKVSQLELLRAQLHALNTKGFENEVHLIEAKLHDVSAINEVKRDLEALRKKVEQKEVSHVGEKRIHSVLFSTSRELKSETGSLKRRISELERVLDKKKKISVKKQLSSSEVEFVKDVPHLERELKKLREAFEEHTKSSHMRVDSGVGTIVDSHFDEFLSSIKGDLSQKLKEKQLGMDSKLKDNLHEQEGVFKRRYKELVEEFNERYKKKVHHNLQQEIRRHFEQQLRARLEEERKSIVVALIKENFHRLATERKNLLHSLESDYRRREDRLKQSLANKNLKISSELKEKRALLERQLELAVRREHELKQQKEAYESGTVKEHQKILKESERLANLREQVREHLKTKERELAAEKNKIQKSFEYNEQSLEGRKKLLDEKKKSLENSFDNKKHLLEQSIKHKFFAGHEHLVQQEKALTSKAKSLDAERKILEQDYERREEALRGELQTYKERLNIGKKKNDSIRKHALEAEKKRLESAFRKSLLEKKRELSLRIEKLAQVRRELAMHADENLKRYKAQIARESASRTQEIKNAKERYAKEHARLMDERRSLESNVATMKAKERAILKEATLRMQKELESHISDNDREFANHAEELKSRARKEIQDQVEVMKRENEARIARELQKKETLLRARLEHEYEERLKAAVAKNEQYLHQKKALLEKRMMEHISKAFS